MKKIAIAAAIGLSALTPPTFAQALNFGGFSLTGALNVNSNSGEAGNKVDATRDNLGVTAQYDVPLGSALVMGLGASLGLNSFDIASNAKLKSTASVFVAPGIAINKQAMVYGKVAVVSAQVDIDGVGAPISGTGTGLGLRYLVNKNLFVQGEYLLHKYNDQTIGSIAFKNQTSVFTMGVGYKF